MTTTAFFGYLFLSCGPPLAAGLPFFYHRSMLSLTTITSMFAWLAIIILVSAMFRAFVPLEQDAAGYFPLLLVTVAVEEAARVGFWFLHKSAGTKLKQLAATASVRFSPLDELALAYAVGWGHGFTHLLFQFGPFLPLTWYTATAYSSNCPNMSIFLVSCLTQLGMFAILAGGHVLFISSISSNRPFLAGVPAIAHLVASLATLGNFLQGGCYTTVAVVLCIGWTVSSAAAAVAWRVASRGARSQRGPGRGVHTPISRSDNGSLARLNTTVSSRSQ